MTAPTPETPPELRHVRVVGGAEFYVYRQPLVSIRLRRKADIVIASGVLRGRLVRVKGRPVSAEVDILGPDREPNGRTTLVPVQDVVDAIPSAWAQMLDAGHNEQHCMCAVCIEKRAAGRPIPRA